jgi:hypothetical protein
VRCRVRNVVIWLCGPAIAVERCVALKLRSPQSPHG